MLEVQSYIAPQYRWKESTAEKLFDTYPDLQRGLGTKYYIEFLHSLMNDSSQKFQQRYNVGAQQAGQDVLNGSNQNDSHNWDQVPDSVKELAKSQIDYQLKEAAKQVIKNRGLIPSELQEKINELLNPKPPVFNWKAYFRRLLGTAIDVIPRKTRRKESERFEGSPGLRKRKKHSILVAIDTSGSVSTEELEDFFSEIYHIWKAGAAIDILECDAQISKPKYAYKGKVPEFISGRGGTSFKEPVDYYNEHRRDYTTMVYFTDGYGDQDEMKPFKQMLWVITSQGNQDSEFPGIKICIPKTKNS